MGDETKTNDNFHRGVHLGSFYHTAVVWDTVLMYTIPSSLFAFS